ncbi:MAG: hypothetical protein AB1349_01730 [Elusimicrobiota bacterium]
MQSQKERNPIIGYRKIFCQVLAICIVGIKILFMNGGVEWGWVLFALVFGYSVVNVGQKVTTGWNQSVLTSHPEHNKGTSDEK